MRNLLQFQLPKSFQATLPFSYQRKLTLFCLAGILFFTGVLTEKIYQLLDQAFYFLSGGFGFLSFLNKSQAEVSSQTTMRSWPTMVTYGLVYTGLCFATLHVYFNNLWKSKITAAFYLAFFGLCMILIIAGKFIPGLEWAYMLCRRLIELVVSPFPVILLIAIFAGFNRK